VSTKNDCLSGNKLIRLKKQLLPIFSLQNFLSNALNGDKTAYSLSAVRITIMVTE
jgi:hypothetical protein